MFNIEKWVHDNRQTQFEWGKSDCCLFTCDYVAEKTGIDPALNHRGTYTTEIGAKRSLVKHGSIQDSFDNAGFERIDFNFAKRGDVVLYNSELGETLGVKWTGGVLGLNENGVNVADVKHDDVIAVWEINQ